MKHLIVFLTLFISASFYGQNEVFEEPVVEGFYGPFFHEKIGNEIHGPMILDFESTTKNMNLLDVLKDINNWEKSYLKLKGIKMEINCGRHGVCNTKITVKEIIEIDTSRTLWSFKKEAANSIVEKEKEIITEGFFVNQFESQCFYLKDGNDLYGPSWTYSDKNLKSVDSLKYITRYHNQNKGMFMVAKGIIKTGNPWGYGHYGACGSEFTISEIISVDTLKTMDNYLLDNIESKGFVIIDNDTLTYPDSFKLNKDYVFKWKEKNKNYKLSVKRINNTTVQFALDCYKKNRLKYTKSGDASLHKYFFKSQERFHHRNDYVCNMDNSEFTISVHDLEDKNERVEVDFVVWKKEKMIIGTDSIKESN